MLKIYMTNMYVCFSNVYLKSNHGMIVEKPTKSKDILTNTLKLQKCNWWVNNQMTDIGYFQKL